MALINCPECKKEISSTAETCPHCGFSLDNANNFTKKSNPLSKKKRFIGAALTWIIPGVIAILAGVMFIFLGGPILIVVSILAILGGASLVTKGVDITKGFQFGDCPYCGTNLRVKCGNRTFKCPVCNNFGDQTETSLESTHDYTPNT